MKHIKLFENWQEDEDGMEMGNTLEYTPSDVNSVTAEEAKSLIVRALNIQANGAGGVKPIMLIGAPGIGKTAAIQKAAYEAGVEPLMLDLSTMDPSDFMGMPKLSSGTMEDTIPSWFPIEGSGILVLDSINRADQQVTNAAIRFAQTGRLGSAELPEGWLIVATSDGSDSDMPISNVISDRFTVLHVHPSAR